MFVPWHVGVFVKRLGMSLRACVRACVRGRRGCHQQTRWTVRAWNDVVLLNDVTDPSCWGRVFVCTVRPWTTMAGKCGRNLRSHGHAGDWRDEGRFARAC